MKNLSKKLSFIIVSICIVLSTGINALAAFEIDHTLTLSIYDDTIEYGYDLGYEVDLSQEAVTLTTGVAISDTSLNISIFYSNYDNLTSVVGLSVDDTEEWSVSSGKAIPLNNTTTDILGFAYGGLLGNSESTVKTMPSDQYFGMGANNYFGSKGNYNGFITGGKPVLQPSLSDIDSYGYVDIYLFKFGGTDGNTIDRGKDTNTDYVAIIRIYGKSIGAFNSGDVVLNPPAINEPPVIKSITATPEQVEEGETVTLTCIATDINSDDLTYTWSTTDTIPDFPTGEDAIGRPIEFKAPDYVDGGDNEYTIQVVVSDGNGGTDEETVSFTVISASVIEPTWPPTNVTATATPSTLNKDGGAVALTATAINGWDISDTGLQWAWSTTYTGVTITNSDAKDASFTAPANTGTAVITIPITLTVTHADHSGGGSVTADVQVKVNPEGTTNNNAPVIKTFPDDQQTAPGATIALNATATDDDEGDTLTYTWSTSDGLSGFPKTGEKISFTVPEDAADGKAYAIKLTVSDGTDTDTDTVTITVVDESGPQADAGADQCIVDLSDSSVDVTLDGSGSTGTNLTYEWEQTSGEAVDGFTNTNQAVVTISVPDSAKHAMLSFKLTVTDGDGFQDADGCNIVVTRSAATCESLPEVDAGNDQTVYETQTVTLDGSNSYPNGATTIEWTKIEGSKTVNIENADQLVATFTAPDIDADEEEYVFQLTMIDANSGYEVSDNVVVTVKENLPPQQAPVSALTPEDGAEVWESTTLRAVLAVQNAEDPDGDALTYDFQIYGYDPEVTSEDEIITAANLIAAGSNVLEGETTTSWRSPELAENTYYWWRARAKDAYHGSAWMTLERFFVNATEEAPGVPEILSPIATGGCANVGASPTLKVANTSDPDDDQLTYEFRIYDSADDPIYEPDIAPDPVAEGTGEEATTEITIDQGLTDNLYYVWRVRAIDDTGLTSDWSEAACFFFSDDNDPPGEPQVTEPGEEVDTNTPIFAIEGGVDPEGQAVSFTIALYGDSFEDADLILTSDPIEKSTDQAATPWPLPEGTELEENTTYRYQVTASDEDGAESETTGTFFVNQYNEPPYTPAILEPSAESDDDTEKTTIVTTLTPKLVLTPADPVDPDQDTVTYSFEVYLSSDMNEAVQSVEGLEAEAWKVDALENGKKYYWRARAVDEHGEVGEWTDLVPFTTGANYYQPSMPEMVSPFDGGTVSTLTPTLLVVATEDGDGDEIWVEFELYRDAALTAFVSYGAESIGTTATTWLVDVTLEDQSEYYWRARATDGENHSAWTAIHSFTVDLTGSNNSVVKVWAVGNYDPSAPWYTVVEVDDDDSDIYGARVIIPPGALSTSETIYVGVASGAPSMDGDLLPFGKVIDFGPSGLTFNVAVTVKIPYSEADLEEAGGVEPIDLGVYTYNETENVWEQIPVSEVDEEEKLLICEVDHFSMYSSATSADGNSSAATDGNSGGGGGGGGCFVNTAGSRAREGKGAGRGMIVVLAVIAAFGAALPARRGVQ